MSRVFKLDVSESQEELELLLKKEKDARRRERLQFLYWYKTGQVTTRKALGELLNRSPFAASFHRAKSLIMPDNVMLLYQPPL